MIRRVAGSASERYQSAANTRLIAGAELLATIAVDHVQRDAGSSDELPGEGPSTDDLVQDAVAATQVVALPEREVINVEQIECVAPVELRWTVVAVGIEVV